MIVEILSPEDIEDGESHECRLWQIISYCRARIKWVRVILIESVLKRQLVRTLPRSSDNHNISKQRTAVEGSRTYLRESNKWFPTELIKVVDAD